MTPRPLPSSGAPFESCVALSRAGRHQEAVEDLRRIVAAQPLHREQRGAAVEALVAISRLAGAAGDIVHATLALEEARRLAPTFADVHYRLALARLQGQQRAGARRSLQEALRINPRYVAARVELALLDAREGMLGEALDTLKRLGEELTLEEPRLFRRGLESLEHADWEGAAMQLREALQLDQSGVQSVVEEFHARMEHGDRAGAARVVRQALASFPSYADLHHLLGVAELEEGHLDDAVSSLARALELHPDFHMARVHLARALEALGDLAQAEEQVAMVLEVDPEHPQATELAERWQRRHRRPERAGRASRKGS
jgi:tetratricopeptide (TPR) repeat protein